MIVWKRKHFVQSNRTIRNYLNTFSSVYDIYWTLLDDDHLFSTNYYFWQDRFHVTVRFE